MPRILLIFACLVALPAQAAESWKAGVAKTVITPDELMWMSGYGARTAPAEGKNDDLMCKAVVLEDGAGGRVVLITLDLVGIDRATSQAVCAELKKKYGLERAQVAINCSHTHCGPVVGTNLKAMYSISEAQWKQVERYTESLQAKIVDTVGRAIQDLAAADISWGSTRAAFAVNRRENTEAEVPKKRAAGETLKGPFDHDVPMLVVQSGNSPTRFKAVVFGYACHATTLGFQQWSADYCGYACRKLETELGATALFWAGCGADQNPIPRRTLELAEKYGHELAEAVHGTVIGGSTGTASILHPLEGKLSSAYSEIPLEFAHIPNKAELEAEAAKGSRYEQGRAKLLLAKLAAEGKLSPTYPYPVQTWRLGSGPQWAILGGEVVVDYVLRLKQELGTDRTWVAGYSNDVMAYIPSRRVLAEGRYEGATSMTIYGQPSPWAPMLEDAIVSEVKRQLGK
jgi:hypothetical protein